MLKEAGAANISFCYAKIQTWFNLWCHVYTTYNPVENILSYLEDPYTKNNIAEEEIGGDDVVVQINASKFGKRKYNKGHHV